MIEVKDDIYVMEFDESVNLNHILDREVKVMSDITAHFKWAEGPASVFAYFRDE